MNKFKRYWTATYISISLIFLAAITFGCVEVGGGTSTSGAEVCSGTECSDNHNESDNSTDNSDSSS